ncbi:hypothetical protein [Alteribacillus iranensis]|uniref:Uncharacterized protein n=1 Tax=Alteribacillus iranensis TaxID=930128 RepID=A0A1I2EWR5_9BACI|nr:hypothetical protein [Alteribacillus iranensis]SFE96906.1 hypothetical protein SAMN05192532_10730 [Alteribacillus iranensis]
MEAGKRTVLVGKRKVTVRLTRMNIYLYSKFIEAVDDQGTCYYFIYFKDEFITVVSASSLYRRSFIEKAWKHGTSFGPTHPFIHELVSSSHAYTLSQHLHTLKQKIEKHHSSQESSTIYTLLDGFFPKKDLFECIRELYYNHRRDGQLFASYRILRVLTSFTPKHSWVKENANDLTFLSYKNLYAKRNHTLWEKDPMFVEKTLYVTWRKQPENVNKWIDLLQSEGRWMDVAALYIKNITRTSSERDYQQLMYLFTAHFPHLRLTSLLEDVMDRTPLPQVQTDLFELYLTSQQWKKAIEIMINHQLTPSPHQQEKIEQLFESLDRESLSSLSVEKLDTFILTLFSSRPGQAEKLLYTCVTHLMASYDLPYVYRWLASLNEASPHTQKVRNMLEWRENPDKQMRLGEMYYYFKQYHQAIDCFSWEMELHDTDPTPVRWLIKLYTETGREEESKLYQTYYKNMTMNT